MLASELRDRIKRKESDGLFLFCGEEDYLKRYYLGELRRLVVTDESLAPFTHFVYEGETVDFGALRDAVCTPSFFGEKRLAEWHLAAIDRMSEKELLALETLAALVRETPDVTVVITATADAFDTGTDRRPSKLYKRLDGALSVVSFPRSSGAQLVSWIGRHFAAEGIACTPALATLLIDRVGHSMDVLASEIGKLVAYLQANQLTALSEKEIEFVSVKTVESDAFSLSNALLDGKTEDAYRFLGDMKRRRIDPITVLGQLSRLYGDMLTVLLLSEEGMDQKTISARLKMHEYKVGLYLKAARKSGTAALEKKLALCAELDASMKNGTPAYNGLERLIAESASGI